MWRVEENNSYANVTENRQKHNRKIFKKRKESLLDTPIQLQIIYSDPLYTEVYYFLSDLIIGKKNSNIYAMSSCNDKKSTLRCINFKGMQGMFTRTEGFGEFSFYSTVLYYETNRCTTKLKTIIFWNWCH